MPARPQPTCADHSYACPLRTDIDHLLGGAAFVYSKTCFDLDIVFENAHRVVRSACSQPKQENFIRLCRSDQYASRKEDPGQEDSKPTITPQQVKVGGKCR